MYKLGYIKPILIILLAFSAKSFSESVDVTNAHIHVIINSNNSTIVSISGGAQGQTNVCLSNDPEHTTQTNRIYSHLLSHYVAGKNLARISFDTSIIVPNCGFKMLTEVR